MLRIDGKSVPRLWVDGDLATRQAVPLGEPQLHYLTRVMRLTQGDAVVLFNGRDGEWLAHLDDKAATVAKKLRDQTREPDIWLIFMPLKKERLRFLVEKATELGVTALQPVRSDFTSGPGAKPDKIRDWAREAAEQCGRLSVPDSLPERPLDDMLRDWDEARCLILADETGQGRPAMDVFRRGAHPPAAVLIGPEGGFSEREHRLIGDVPVSVSVGLGPHILRSETAAMVTLAYWQATQGNARVPVPVAQDTEHP